MKRIIISFLLCAAMLVSLGTLVFAAEDYVFPDGFLEEEEIYSIQWNLLPENEEVLSTQVLPASVSFDELIRYALEIGEDLFFEIDGELYPFEYTPHGDIDITNIIGIRNNIVIFEADEERTPFTAQKTISAVFLIAGQSIRVFDITVYAAGEWLFVQDTGAIANVQWHSFSISNLAQGISIISSGPSYVVNNNSSNPSIFVPVTFSTEGGTVSSSWAPTIF